MPIRTQTWSSGPFAAYEDRHTSAVIENVTTTCRTDIAGQTAPGAHQELLERLVRQRLNDLPPHAAGPQTHLIRAVARKGASNETVKIVR